jgi:hypothetical protein
MSDNEEPQKDLINFAFAELTKALKDAKSGKSPTQAYGKLKQAYDTLSEAEKKRENQEITDEEMQATMAKEVEKLKGGL